MVLAIGILSGCSVTSSNEFDIFLSQSDANHKMNVEETNIPDFNVDLYPESLLGQYNSMKPWYLYNGEGKSMLTIQEAKEDVEAFFQLLHDFYGGYGYFGGDATFWPALEQVLNSFSDKSNISSKSLQQGLEAVLEPLIQDAHFSINGRYLCASTRQNMYYVPEIYLDEIQAKTIDPMYLKRTIGPDGALSYCFATLSTQGTELPKQLGEYTDLAWTLAEPAPSIGTTVYDQQNVDGLTVLVNQVLSDLGADENWGTRLDELNQFASSGTYYRDLPLFVIDLRGNIGGQPMFVSRWFEGFTGVTPSLYQSILIRWAPENGFIKAMGYSVPNTPGAVAIYESAGNWVEHDGIIFCLIDNATASAGEWFVQYLQTIEHVIFVGSNTCGATLMTNNQTYYLPNSKLSVSFGNSMMLTPDGNTDEIGFQPDLWVNPSDALESVINMCKYYKLS